MWNVFFWIKVSFYLSASCHFCFNSWHGQRTKDIVLHLAVHHGQTLSAHHQDGCKHSHEHVATSEDWKKSIEKSHQFLVFLDFNFGWTWGFQLVRFEASHCCFLVSVFPAASRGPEFGSGDARRKNRSADFQHSVSSCDTYLIIQMYSNPLKEFQQSG